MTVQNRHMTPCTPAPKTCRCPECGGLECLCRPRFFAGQLLTDEDLNRLDHYIRARFRMHNLSLHGTGVVGGLKVICDPCGEVMVTHGHAISPCGDDIIVCEDVAVPVCDLIEKCRKAERADLQCDPPRRIPGSDCEGVEEEWVLAIKYDERPTRGVLPLRAGVCKSCGCGCDCDGGGCECDACCDPPQKTAPKPRGAPTECEPTVICEGFRFCVYRKPEAEDPQDDERIQVFDDDSALVAQLRCCIEILTGVLPAMPNLGNIDINNPAHRQQLVTYLTRLRGNLIDYYSRYPHTNCEIMDILKRLPLPDPGNAQTFSNDFVNTFIQLVAIWLDGIRQCICLALLPPAPVPVCDDRVPLACIRVTGGCCSVLSVCNWCTERKLLISWTSVGYWLGSLGIWDFLREALDAFCCNNLLGIFRDPIGYRDPIGSAPQPGAERPSGATLAGAAAATAAPGSEPTTLAARFDAAWTRIHPQLQAMPPTLNLEDFVKATAKRGDAPISIGALLNATSKRFSLPDAKDALAPAEVANLPTTIAVEFIGKPILAGIAAGSNLFRDDGGKSAAGPGTGTSGDELRSMRAELDRQREEIAALKRAMERNGD